MEVSQYCDVVRHDAGRWMAFSAVTGKRTLVADRIRAAILSDDLTGLSLGEKIHLAQLGILVSSREEEQRAVWAKLREYRENSEVLRYTLVTTYACNLRCPYCYEDAMASRRGVMDDAVADGVLAKIRRDLAATGAKHVGITLYGGEPLLNLPPAMRVFSELERHRAKVDFALHGAMISNGTLFTEENVEAMSPHIQFVQLTFDGGPAFHNTIRVMHGGEPSFDRICQAARLLVRQGVRVMIRIQVSQESLPSLSALFPQLEKYGLLNHDRVKLYFFPILDVRSVCSSKSFRCGTEYYEPGLFEHLWRYGSQFGVMVTTPPVPVWVSAYCSFVNRGACLIDPVGQIYKCVADVGKPECVVGSVMSDGKGRPQEQTEAQRMCEARFNEHSGLAFSQCRACSYLPLCDGGCAHFAARGREGEADAPSCDLHLRAIKAWLQQPLETANDLKEPAVENVESGSEARENAAIGAAR